LPLTSTPPLPGHDRILLLPESSSSRLCLPFCLEVLVLGWSASAEKLTIHNCLPFMNQLKIEGTAPEVHFAHSATVTINGNTPQLNALPLWQELPEPSCRFPPTGLIGLGCINTA
jgi:hypothetical protein